LLLLNPQFSTQSAESYSLRDERKNTSHINYSCETLGAADEEDYVKNSMDSPTATLAWLQVLKMLQEKINI
jgi:hypothetical protein